MTKLKPVFSHIMQRDVMLPPWFAPKGVIASSWEEGCAEGRAGGSINSNPYLGRDRGYDPDYYSNSYAELQHIISKDSYLNWGRWRHGFNFGQSDGAVSWLGEGDGQREKDQEDRIKRPIKVNPDEVIRRYSVRLATMCRQLDRAKIYHHVAVARRNIINLRKLFLHDYAKAAGCQASAEVLAMLPVGLIETAMAKAQLAKASQAVPKAEAALVRAEAALARAKQSQVVL